MKIMVGGAPVDSKFAEKIGADVMEKTPPKLSDYPEALLPESKEVFFRLNIN